MAEGRGLELSALIEKSRPKSARSQRRRAPIAEPARRLAAQPPLTPTEQACRLLFSNAAVEPS